MAPNIIPLLSHALAGGMHRLHCPQLAVPVSFHIDGKKNPDLPGSELRG